MEEVKAEEQKENIPQVPEPVKVEEPAPVKVEEPAPVEEKPAPVKEEPVGKILFDLNCIIICVYAKFYQSANG